MKSVLRIYMILITGVLLTTFAVVTALKLNTTNPVAPTAPTTQQAAEVPVPISNTINFKVKINGITANGPASLKGFVTMFPPVFEGINTPPPASVSANLYSTILQRTTDGTYIGSIPNPAAVFYSNGAGGSTITANIARVTILVKAEKHAQRTFVTAMNPAIVTDLTSGPLEPGDLPNSQQDGTVNQKDIDYIKSKMFTNDSAADLNYDGVVNAGDLSLIIDTLSNKADALPVYDNASYLPGTY